jgi:hypothetical protein
MMEEISASLNRKKSSLFEGKRRRKLRVIVLSNDVIALLSTREIAEGGLSVESVNAARRDDLISLGRRSKIKSTVECEPCPKPDRRTIKLAI